ncbi:hypothetical protein K458DRAFT_446360 [Lentithecium fluviatile CBS 122367]|uniref:Uncharacterized protein n=1 Tax=Lentithecium fluviatile CBS 122367 TaxID=1168545 RepID=A0A6G1IL29_9PLEO|nr:hypothetical protein K458DRAFT_446360 [Lentithecium fluviatile CBS 122367]
MAENSDSSNLLELFHGIQERLDTTNGSIKADSWYVLVLSALTASGKPGLAADLYQHLISLPQYTSSDSRKMLMQRLRETLVKSVSVIGVARPLEAVMCIDTVTSEEDKDTSFSREHWKNDEANHERGSSWLKKLYSDNLNPINEIFATQRDFGWISNEIMYGLYLSDHRILDVVETEMVVLSGMIAQNLPRMTA